MFLSIIPLLLLLSQPIGTALWLEASRAAVPCLTHFICSSLEGRVLSMGPLGQPLILWEEAGIPPTLEETEGLILSQRTSPAGSLWGKEEGVSG